MSGGHHDRHLLAFQQRLSLDLRVIADLLREADQEISAEVRVTDLSSTELDRHLDPIAFLQELD